MDTTDAPQLIEHINKSVMFTPTETKWIPCSARCVVLGQHPKGTGALHVYELNSGDFKVLAELEKKDALKCGTFGASSLAGRQLATGDYGGNLNIWDLERPDIASYSVKVRGRVEHAGWCRSLVMAAAAVQLLRHLTPRPPLSPLSLPPLVVPPRRTPRL